MWLDFSNITLKQKLTSDQKAFDTHSVVVKQDAEEDQWVYLLISGSGVPRTGRRYVPAAHPIHLHGHDFAILQQSTKKYQIGGLDLNLKNPPRRDVAFMPRDGFLVLAFKADNTGVWLMHCKRCCLSMVFVLMRARSYCNTCVWWLGNANYRKWAECDLGCIRSKAAQRHLSEMG